MTVTIITDELLSKANAPKVGEVRLSARAHINAVNQLEWLHAGLVAEVSGLLDKLAQDPEDTKLKPRIRIRSERASAIRILLEQLEAMRPE